MDIDAVSQGHVPLQLPLLSSDELRLLCASAKELFRQDSVALQITGSVVIIGDLHGQILDLFRIIQTYGLPELHKYLFLGDIVDRGEFSIETCSLVYALKVKYPASVFVIRGNHEFAFLCRQCGFQAEITSMYGAGSPLFESFLESFAFIPITALIAQKILCVHGGLGPGWFSLSQSDAIERPIYEFTDDLLEAMLWSDPNPAIDGFEGSTRGAGYIFGGSPLVEFLDSNCVKLLVRAHECVNTGYQFLFNDRLVTVFSASNYGGLLSNNSAVLEVSQDGVWSPRQFLPLGYLKRTAVKFGKLMAGGAMLCPVRPLPAARMVNPSVPKLPSLTPSVPVFADGRGNRAISARPSWPQPAKTPAIRAPRKIF